MGKKVIASGGDNGPNTIYKVRIYTPIPSGWYLPLLSKRC